MLVLPGCGIRSESQALLRSKLLIGRSLKVKQILTKTEVERFKDPNCPVFLGLSRLSDPRQQHHRIASRESPYLTYIAKYEVGLLWNENEEVVIRIQDRLHEMFLLAVDTWRLKMLAYSGHIKQCEKWTRTALSGATGSAIFPRIKIVIN